MVLLGYSGAGGKLIHEKKPEAKNLVTLSFERGNGGDTLYIGYPTDHYSRVLG
jgi:hypothetical protein